MEPGQLIYALLSQAPDVAALVATRIYPLRIEQSQPRPAIAYQLISNTNDGLARCRLNDNARVQVGVFADTYAQLCALSAAVRTALDGYEAGGVTIDFANVTDRFDDGADCFFRPVDFLLSYAP